MPRMTPQEADKLKIGDRVAYSLCTPIRKGTITRLGMLTFEIEFDEGGVTVSYFHAPQDFEVIP